MYNIMFKKILCFLCVWRVCGFLDFSEKRNIFAKNCKNSVRFKMLSKMKNNDIILLFKICFESVFI